jgi:hypothetical protein
MLPSITPPDQPAQADQPVIAFGPRMPGWGSWDWVGSDLQTHLASTFRTISFGWEQAPSCDVLVVVKHVPPAEFLARLSPRTAVIFCPVDAYGRAADIDLDRAFLRRCARVVVHCERLRRYFEPVAPVVYLDHHVKFLAPPRETFCTDGFFLWVGVRSNLPPLVEWVNAHPLPGPLRVLTNLEDPRHAERPAALGFRLGVDVQVAEWSPRLHSQWAQECRAALDIKGGDFRSRHKPPAKAIDFIASGVPLAMNADASPVEHLGQLGFAVASPSDPGRWLSLEYWQDTRRFGAALRELLCLERIGRRWQRLLEEVLSGRR